MNRSQLNGSWSDSLRADSDLGLTASTLLTLVLTLVCTAASAAPVAEEPYRVLIMHSFRFGLPVNADWQNGLVRGFTDRTEQRVELDIETPDLMRLSDASYLSSLIDLYRQKYRDQKPDLIISTYTPALRFMLEHGDDAFPGVPVVFLGADSRFVAAQKLPAHYTGITAIPDFAGTLELALHVHPGTRQVAVIVGSSAFDEAFERDARQAFQAYADRIEFLWLKGLPRAELVEAVRRLPKQTVLLYLVQLQDRSGEANVPVNTMRALSAAAPGPIYALWDTLLEHGTIGGRMATLEADGFQAAQMSMRILRGEAPAAIPVVYRKANSAIFHGRELARWSIDEDQLPDGSRILQRQLSLWEEHRSAILIAGLVIGVQGLLIAFLVLNGVKLKRTKTALHSECERRGQMEALASRQEKRVNRLGKERSLGAMATGIAHEINQPLIAIQNYAQAATRRLASVDDQAIPRIAQMLQKVEEQADRAGAIIHDIRALVSTDDANLVPVSLGSVVDQVIQMMGPELRRQRCRVDLSPVADVSPVLADELQIQLVLVNLLRNAAEAMDAMEEDSDKVVDIEMRPISDREVQVSVADRGPGIAPGKGDHVFEPFYSESAKGMGIGLAVCKSITEAHGGRIWHTPNPGGGSIFRFTLRRAVH